MIQRLKRLMRRMAEISVTVPASFLDAYSRSVVLERIAARSKVEVRLPSGSVNFLCSSPQLYWRATTVMEKEADIIQWLNQIPVGAVLWDIGANIGTFSIFAAKERGARVLAFEPAAANYHVLCQNIWLNGFDRNVQAYCLAFAERPQFGVLNLASVEMGAAVNQFGRAGEKSPYLSPATATVTQGMIGLSIDSFVQQHAPPFPSYIKIDVDGLETDILKGAVETLRDPRIRSVVVELSVSDREKRDQACQLLTQCGFKLVGTGPTQGTEEATAANHVFNRS